MPAIQKQDSFVRARINSETKEKAVNALAKMGLSVSDAIRLLLIQVANECRLPFEVKVPNDTTLQAMEELESGKGRRFKSVEEMMETFDAGN